MKIISFCGRMRSGKTELAQICEKYGYERIYFAKPLKKLIADLINGTIEDVNRLKNGAEGWSKEITILDCNYVNEQTNIPINYVNEKLLGQVFTTTRDMLQIIGTNLIREYNPNWHVDRIREMLEEDKNYVFDDTRFTNECKMVEELGGDNWFVIRPNTNEISHHISEETLRWQDFSNIIINDKSLEFFKLLWDVFMKTGYDISFKARKEELKRLYENEEYRNEFVNNQDDINSLSFLQISKSFFNYNSLYKNSTDIAEVKLYGENQLAVSWQDTAKDSNIISNPLEIEDLKIYI